MATLIEGLHLEKTSSPPTATNSTPTETDHNNRTSPSSSISAAVPPSTPPLAHMSSSTAPSSAPPPAGDLWAALEKQGDSEGGGFLRDSSGSSSASDSGNKWKRRGVHLTLDEGAEDWDHATLTVSSDGTNMMGSRKHPRSPVSFAPSSSLPSSFMRPSFPPDSTDEGEEDGDSEEEAEAGQGTGEPRARRGAMSISRSHDASLKEGESEERSSGDSGSRFQRKREKRESYARLMELLAKDNLLLLEAICSSVLSHVEDETDIIIPELVRYMLSTQVATDIIVRLIRAEVANAVEEGTILRGNEPISIMLTAHAKIVGHSFLCQMLKPEIALLCDEINQHKLQLEIDPVKMKGKGDATSAVEQNVQSLTNVAGRFLERIKSCLHLFPSQIRHISSEMRRCLLQRFPASTVDSVLGGYIFLRLICPVIVSPDSAGMSGQEGFYLKDGMLQKDTIRISPEAQRGLVLLSKTLQQLANGTDFGWKEGYMIPLNQFLQQCRPTISHIFETVSTPTTDSGTDDHVTLEKGEIHLVKFIFHKLVYLGMGHIEAFVRARENGTEENAAAKSYGQNNESESEAMRILAELRQVMSVLGKPPRSLRKYRDIVFYEHAQQREALQAAAGDHKKEKKKLKKLKKKLKKKSKEKKEKEALSPPATPRRRVGRSGIVRLGHRTAKGDGEDPSKWKSDSCSNVKVLDRTKVDLRVSRNAIVRRVRSSDQDGERNVADQASGGDEVALVSSGETTGADSEEAVVRLMSGDEPGGDSSSEDSSYTSDFDFDESEDDYEKPAASTGHLRRGSVVEGDKEKEKEEKMRKKSEIAKKLLEEKYKSYSMRNLRSERAAMMKDAISNNKSSDKEMVKEKKEKQRKRADSASSKKGARSITLTDLQVVKRERDNEVLRSVGALSPRGRNYTSPPAQHHQIQHDDDSSSSDSSSSEDESAPSEKGASRAQTRPSKLTSRMPILRIPTREDFKFLSPRRPAPSRKDEIIKHN